jgi:hypothetical protein
MKTLKWIPLVLLLPALFLLTGCPNPEEEGTVPNVTNLTITADSEGDGLIITWDQVSDVDGYDLYTPDGDTILLDYDETSYNDNTPSQTGTYEVVTVSGSDYSSGVTVSSAPYVGSSNLTVYGWNETGDSGFGFTVSTGSCQTYSCVGTTYADVIDFFFYDQGGYYDFISGDEDPYQGNKTSHIVNMQTSDFVEAPASGYFNMEGVVAGNYYAVSVQGDYYGKLYVVSAGATDVTFSYEFQTIQHLRLF